MLTLKVLPGYTLGLYLIIRAIVESDVWMTVAALGVFLLTEIYAGVMRQLAEITLLRMNSVVILNMMLRTPEGDKKEKN